jgi:hypothetical protein
MLYVSNAFPAERYFKRKARQKDEKAKKLKIQEK